MLDQIECPARQRRNLVLSCYLFANVQAGKAHGWHRSGCRAVLSHGRGITQAREVIQTAQVLELW